MVKSTMTETVPSHSRPLLGLCDVKRYCITTRQISMAPETAVNYSSNFVILKFIVKFIFSDTDACQGLHLSPLCDVM